jgi:putative transposase
MARIVVPGLPHHVTQRGNRRDRIFFEESDYALYRDLLAAACRKADVAVLSLLPDAEPYASDPGARRCDGLGAGARRNASAPCGLRQCARP